MKRNIFGAAVGALLATAAINPAYAGPLGDELTKCMISSTTAQDKSVMVRWVFATLALHPDTAPLASVSAQQRSDLNAGTARLFERVMTENCKAQTQAAVRSEGPSALQQSFRQFGEAATRELLSNQQVANGLTATAGNLNLMKLMDLLP